MPIYSFFITKTALREASVEVESASFQDACQQLAALSQKGLDWEASVDMGGDQTVVRLIRKDGEAIDGVVDPMGGAPGWWGLHGVLDTEDLPEEFLAVRD